MARLRQTHGPRIAHPALTAKDRDVVGRVPMYKDFAFSIVKIVPAVASMSLFLCIVAAYSVMLGLARKSYLDGRSRAGGDVGAEWAHYRRIALFTAAGGLVSMASSAHTFSEPSRADYGTIPAITIALLAFTELGFAVVGILKAKDLLQSGLKCVNLTAAFVAVVLTQVALTSLTPQEDFTYYNALGGLFFGGLSVLVSGVMLARCLWHRRGAAGRGADGASER